MRETYSRLRFLLEERGLTRADLHHRLQAQGGSVVAKTLSRLADPDRPIKQVETRVAEAICRALDVDLGE